MHFYLISNFVVNVKLCRHIRKSTPITVDRILHSKSINVQFVLTIFLIITYIVLEIELFMTVMQMYYLYRPHIPRTPHFYCLKRNNLLRLGVKTDVNIILGQMKKK